MNKLAVKAFELREDVLKMVMSGKCGHIGGDMSVMEILVAIYDRMNVSPSRLTDPDRDRFVMSKGHCVEALYSVLGSHGFVDIDEIIPEYSHFGSKYIGHPTRKIPGVEMNSGSLGHGLPVSVGMALAGKRDGKNYRVYTVMGDGELAEGSVWEATMAAANYKLDNLCAVIDRNGLQISGSTEDVMKHGDLASKFRSFGWNAIVVERGNDIVSVCDALDKAEATIGKPTAIIAMTTKGFGSELMENKAEWHHKVPTEEEAAIILADFRKRKEILLNE